MARVGGLGAAVALAAALALGAPAAAQGTGEGAAAPASAEAVGRGPVTGLPLPRYVSLKASRANARRGPGTTHRVDWVFVRRGMPLEVIAEHGHWRRVRDSDSATGWVHYSLIRGDRTAIVTAEQVDFRETADPAAPVTARAEKGVIVDVAECIVDWCRVSRGRVGGWAPKSALWGVAPGEVFD